METEHESPLNPLQLKILTNAARGLTAKQTGEALGYSKKYVQNVLQSVHEDLDAANTVEAVAIALTERWIALPPKE
jgi:DNA-binding NarL/FixJ family response regulator